MGNLEDFAYFTTVENEDGIAQAHKAGTEFLDRPHTPPNQLEDPEPIQLNYKRKRQATSPGNDIREQQRNINNRISNLNNTFQSLVGTIEDLVTQRTSDDEEDETQTNNLSNTST